jgi:LmbE family N-acetylglucosaminyl deacetylase
MIILGIGAHPDDLDFGSAGSFAKWAKEGHCCYYLVCTDGSKGSDDPNMTEKRLIALRRQEQKDAAKILGVKDVFFLNHKDTELVADLILKKEIVRYIRKLKPNIVLTLDPTFIYSAKRGFINHTDHRAVGQAALDAVFPMARDRLTFKELEKEGLTPHKVSTLYLTKFEDYNEIVDISETIDLKVKALLAHKTQIDKEVSEMMKGFAHLIGEKYGYKYAEGFVKFNLPQM